MNLIKKNLLLAFFALLPLKGFSYQFYAEAKVGYYRFDDSTLRLIFGDGGPGYQAELGAIFCGCFGIALNAEYFCDSGRAFIKETESTRFAIDRTNVYKTHETKVQLTSFALVPKWFFHLNQCFHPYIGAGPRFFFLDIKNRSPYVERHVNKFQTGGSFTGGAHIQVGCFFLDPFIDYSLVKMSFSKKKSSTRQDRNFSHLLVGIGFGVDF